MSLQKPPSKSRPRKSGSFSFPPQIPLRGPVPRTRHRQVPPGTVDQRCTTIR
ncbi:hypothetical protein CsatB_013607 [Cannabis sativa]